jgi:glycosyltransferase involved in cell wall biosynthesis
MKPTIAILIPCYNSSTYLRELFEGIHKQTIPFDEVICYDDKSTDGTVAMAKSLGAIVIEGSENKGPSYGRNRMIATCSCDYIHFHDSDDLIDTTFVEEMLQQMENENTQLLCNSYVLDRENRKQNLGNIIYNNLEQSDDQLAYFLENVGFASMGLYHKKALQKIGGFREDLKANEDPDLHIRLVLNGFKIKPTKQFLVTKLEHKNSYSHQNWMMCMENKLICLETYFNSIPKKYLPIIGLQAATLSNYFYREHHAVLSKRARLLAYQCGVKQLNTSTFASFVSKYFGLAIYLWLYRKRIDFNIK